MGPHAAFWGPVRACTLHHRAPNTDSQLVNARLERTLDLARLAPNFCRAEQLVTRIECVEFAFFQVFATGVVVREHGVRTLDEVRVVLGVQVSTCRKNVHRELLRFHRLGERDSVERRPPSSSLFLSRLYGRRSVHSSRNLCSAFRGGRGGAFVAIFRTNMCCIFTKREFVDGNNTTSDAYPSGIPKVPPPGAPPPQSPNFCGITFIGYQHSHAQRQDCKVPICKLTTTSFFK